jgi:hypothetical protein
MSTDGEGGIAGCRVLAPAGLDELDLVRVQAAYAAPASSCLAGWPGCWRPGSPQPSHRCPVQMDDAGPGQVAAGAVRRGPHHRYPHVLGEGSGLAGCPSR